MLILWTIHLVVTKVKTLPRVAVSSMDIVKGFRHLIQNALFRLDNKIKQEHHFTQIKVSMQIALKRLPRGP
jgi:hypothetical protein